MRELPINVCATVVRWLESLLYQSSILVVWLVTRVQWILYSSLCLPVVRLFSVSVSVVADVSHVSMVAIELRTNDVLVAKTSKDPPQ